MKTDLTTVDHWESLHGPPSIEFSESNIIHQWIKENLALMEIKDLSLLEIKDCIEIGCYPGRYLGMMAQHGYSVNGLDYIDSVKKIEPLITSLGGKVGDLFCADFRTFKTEKTYDLVFSLGFIEHFSDWEFMLRKHIALVKPGGHLLIEVPNYRGLLQRVPRFLFDNKNYHRHNLSSMDLKRWQQICEQEGFKVLKSEPIGGYGLWFVRNAGPVERRMRSMFVKILSILKNILFPATKDHTTFSSALIFLAKRPEI